MPHFASQNSLHTSSTAVEDTQSIKFQRRNILMDINNNLTIHPEIFFRIFENDRLCPLSSGWNKSEYQKLIFGFTPKNSGLSLPETDSSRIPILR
jgi:hypothetical protein